MARKEFHHNGCDAQSTLEILLSLKITEFEEDSVEKNILERFRILKDQVEDFHNTKQYLIQRNDDITNRLDEVIQEREEDSQFVKDVSQIAELELRRRRVSQMHLQQAVNEKKNLQRQIHDLRQQVITMASDKSIPNAFAEESMNHVHEKLRIENSRLRQELKHVKIDQKNTELVAQLKLDLNLSNDTCDVYKNLLENEREKKNILEKEHMELGAEHARTKIALEETLKEKKELETELTTLTIQSQLQNDNYTLSLLESIHLHAQEMKKIPMTDTKYKTFHEKLLKSIGRVQYNESMAIVGYLFMQRDFPGLSREIQMQLEKLQRKNEGSCVGSVSGPSLEPETEQKEVLGTTNDINGVQAEEVKSWEELEKPPVTSLTRSVEGFEESKEITSPISDIEKNDLSSIPFTPHSNSLATSIDYNVVETTKLGLTI